MEINEYESHGRTLLVEFKCYRCKKTETRTLKEIANEGDGYNRGLYDLNPPTGWKNGGFYHPLFCPDCKNAYERFMNNEDVERRSEDGKASS